MKDPERLFDWREFTTMPAWDEMRQALDEIKMKEISAVMAAADQSDLPLIRYHKGRVDGISAVQGWMEQRVKEARQYAAGRSR